MDRLEQARWTLDHHGDCPTNACPKCIAYREVHCTNANTLKIAQAFIDGYEYAKEHMEEL